MKRRKYIKTIALGAFVPGLSTSAFPFNMLGEKVNNVKADFKSNWEHWPDMKWIGPQYWGNRLQDWQLRNGKAICTITDANRSLQLLTVQKIEGQYPFKVGVDMSLLNKNISSADEGCIGVRLGSKGPFNDYRSAAVFGNGMDIGFSPNGNIQVGDRSIETGFKQIPATCRLEADFRPNGKEYLLNVSILDAHRNKVLFSKENIPVNADNLTGNFALLAHVKLGTDDDPTPSIAFADWRISSDDLYVNEDQLFGPICFAQYTLHRNKLKITAQLAPLEQIDGHNVLLQFEKKGVWETAATAKIDHPGRAVHFEEGNWNHSTDVPYRILVEIPLTNEIHRYTYVGTVAKEPTDKDEIRTAVFSCNFHYGFPDADVVKNMSKLNPDIVLFLGDQFYEGTGGFGIQRTGDFDGMCLDYLRKWMMFGWSYRELFRHRPCPIIPDDHDVYHGNVWGEGGAKADTSKGFGAEAQDTGGYKMPAEWVNMVQFTQTSHLPDPYDPTPVKQGIGVYYTNWDYAGLSFAILEDRKFKSAPKQVLPKEAEVWNGFIKNPNFDIKEHRNIKAELLGERQHAFLDDWVENWDEGIQMKVVLSQTNFATVATLPKEALTDEVVPSLHIPNKGQYVTGDRLTADMDSNGWPANERDRAVEKIRKCFAFHIAGDQHMASFIRYGVEGHGDSGFAFTGPALNNIWPRRFWPPQADIAAHSYKNPAYVGDHIDGFGNKMTVLAAANPYDTGLKPEIIHNRATGYGLVSFNKRERTIKTECWSRFMDPTGESGTQNPGWPITVKQADNYGRKAVAWLPELRITDGSRPVLSIYSVDKELVYCIRLASDTFRPKVFEEGEYTLILKDSENNIIKSLRGIKAKKDNIKTIEVNFKAP